jgi:hypothetical protein
LTSSHNVRTSSFNINLLVMNKHEIKEMAEAAKTVEGAAVGEAYL